MDGRAFRGYAGSSQASSAWGGSRAGTKVAGSGASPSAVSTLRVRWMSTTNAVTVRRPPHGQPNAADTLTQSVPHSVTSEMGRALLDVADVIQPHPGVVAVLPHVEDEGFLDELANHRRPSATTRCPTSVP